MPEIERASTLRKWGHVAALVRFAPIRLIPSAENNENKTKNEADNNIYCFGYPIKIIFTSSCYTTQKMC